MGAVRQRRGGAKENEGLWGREYILGDGAVVVLVRVLVRVCGAASLCGRPSGFGPLVTLDLRGL